ncbi:hypothetical protein P152DRAFT_157244 [Eremomyces bilateralis CBS 781.70]|uniref:MYND-type domain-containing protein n=1 Tax=Eremomyces bilateralis CBS 781.70 TaxID=1392243 RepID=A0A6G1FVG2_9PEZI|nr:uncharacterized protein P152DRAFT_157244 [Eremomyces bilateralis CBS 781.70]KAF1809696.1 hypothetical protein P152DRAFT_157244 [Eremomyces bilateralis CBS 781.70]
MVDWKSEAGLYNRLPRPRFLTDGSENHWHIEINRIEENTGRIHFTQKCSAAVQFQSRAIVELPEEGSIELAKVVVDRLIYNFLFPGKRIASGVRSNRVLISGRFAPYILETRTAEFAACLGQVMEEVGIKKLPHIVIEPQDDIAGQNLQADAETACTTMDDPQSTDIDIEAGLSMFDDPESTKADIEASFSIFDDPQNTEVDIEAEVSMVVSPHGTEVDVEASFPMFDNAQGTEVGVEASFAIFDNTQSHSPMWLPRRSHAANPTASYSSRAGRIPEGLRTTIQELFGCTPDDPMFSTKALGTDDVTISLSQKLSKSPDFLEELFVSPRFRGACAKILDPSENGVNDKIWDLGAFPILLMLLRPPKRGLLHKSAHKSNQRQAPKQPMTIESSSKAAPGSWPETSGEELGDSPEQSRETGETSSSKPDPGPEISRKSKAREPPTVKVERPSLTQHEPTPIPTNCTVCKSASTPEELELFPCRYCQRIWYCSRVCLRFEAATHSGVCFKRVPPRRRREGTEKRPEVASKESPKDPNREDLSGKDPSGEPPSGEGSNEEEPHRHSPNEEHLNMEELDDHHTSSDALREESPTGKERGKKKPKEGAPDYQCKHLRGPTRVCQSCKKREATLKRPLKLCRCKKVQSIFAPSLGADRCWAGYSRILRDFLRPQLANHCSPAPGESNCYSSPP